MKSPEGTDAASEPKGRRWPLGKPSREDLISFRELARYYPGSPITRQIDRILQEETE